LVNSKNNIGLYSKGGAWRRELKKSSSLQWRGRLKILIKCAPIPNDKEV
jgi:hypothetical protein